MTEYPRPRPTWRHYVRRLAIGGNFLWPVVLLVWWPLLTPRAEVHQQPPSPVRQPVPSTVAPERDPAPVVPPWQPPAPASVPDSHWLPPPSVAPSPVPPPADPPATATPPPVVPQPTATAVPEPEPTVTPDPDPVPSPTGSEDSR